MSERTTLEIIAPTVEEALSQGLSQLGLPADAVSVEVLDAGNKGFFGLGGRQVRVRLTVLGPQEVAPPVAPRTETKAAPQPSQPARPAAPARVEAAPAPAPKPAPKPAPVKAEKPRPEAVPAREKRKAEKPKAEALPPARTENDPLLDTTEAVVLKLLGHLKLRAQVSARYMEDSTEDRRNILVDVRGDDLSILIGRHAETLNAFQYVASLMVGKESEQWVQLTVDVEGFRNRRERQIRQLASRMADQVAKTGRRASLEPMPSNERRIVHLELRDHPSVTTESTGDEPHRKVVIKPRDP
ncbi:MAG: Jag N-terminal domain-containing protein [Chloroflexi bacterium]|nr:Jag N-terminal domain-containing protein [Chloroflexota bacterium]